MYLPSGPTSTCRCRKRIGPPISAASAPARRPSVASGRLAAGDDEAPHQQADASGHAHDDGRGRKPCRHAEGNVSHRPEREGQGAAHRGSGCLRLPGSRVLAAARRRASTGSRRRDTGRRGPSTLSLSAICSFVSPSRRSARTSHSRGVRISGYAGRPRFRIASEVYHWEWRFTLAVGILHGDYRQRPCRCGWLAGWGADSPALTCPARGANLGPC